ncbi:MAG: hypothetical protein RG740_03330, partial [Acholeplasmataceae bacterium]|nr:hypothetical protein [Acholeplasmataceae bacterium]
NIASVQPFEAQVLADAGIEIALGDLGDGVNPSTLNWVTTLTTEDIMAYIGELGTFRFDHVTTSDGIEFWTLGSGSLSRVYSGFLEIPLHFRSNNATGINWTSVSLTSGLTPWIADVAFTSAQGDAVQSGQSISVDAASAMRIAIQGTVNEDPNHVVGYEKAGSTTNVYLGTGGDLRGDEIGEPESGIYYGANGAMNYFYRKNNELPAGIDAVATLATLTEIGAEKVLDMESGQALTAGNEYYGKVTLRIWLEGWDADAYNAILNRVVTVALSFQGDVEDQE